MPFIARAPTGRFRPEALLAPKSVTILGADTPAGIQVLENLREAAFPGPIHTQIAEADLAIIADETLDLAATYAALAEAGTRAAVVTGMASGLRALALSTGVRSLGPGSFGIAVPSLGLNATRAHLPIPKGRLALVSQSAALCRAVLDWAEPNGVGFSHIVGIGGNDDIGFALILDWLSRDNATSIILLDIRRIKDPRAFLSAARAAARLRPVVAIRAGAGAGVALATFDAALQRAGVLTVGSLDDLLAAAETLTRARPPRHDTLAIVTNAIGPAQMAADAALRQGLTLASLTDATRAVISLTLPGAFAPPAGAEPIGNIIYVGADGARLAETAALLSGAKEIGAVIAVHAPTHRSDAAAIAALSAAGAAIRLPLLACVMGETTGAAHRRTLASSGIPVFATPEAAVRGFLHLIQHRRTRLAAAELPSSTVLEITPAPGAPALLAAYAIPANPALRIRVGTDPMFGPTIAVEAGGSFAVDLPPLNLPLAHALLNRLRHDSDDLADTLVRVSQLIIDVPIASLVLDPTAPPDLILLPAGTIRPPLALPPYPAHLITRLPGITIRPIRPEDAEAHAAFFARLTPEDIRYRFFSAIRALSPEQIVRMTQIDYDREMAFLAVRDATHETIGVARLVRLPLSDEGEFAVVVQGDMKGTGLATHLMQAIIAWGRSRAMTAVTGQVLNDNQKMRRFIQRLGFTLHRIPGEPDVLEARLDLSA